MRVAYTHFLLVNLWVWTAVKPLLLVYVLIKYNDFTIYTQAYKQNKQT